MKILWRHWFSSFALAFVLLFLFGWWHGSFTNLFILNRAFADVGFVLIGLSFALSGVCHFCKLNRFLFHRKYLGLVGFLFTLIHGVASLPLFKINYYFSTFLNLWSFILGVIALLFFAWLAVISTSYWIRRLKKHWRIWLRWGYVAFVFSIVHIALLYWRSWMFWFQNPSGFLQPSLVVTFFGVLVVLLRLALFLKVKK